MYQTTDPIVKNVFADTKAFYKQVVIDYEHTKYYDTYELNLMWGGQAMQDMHSVIYGCDNALDAISAIHNTFLYSINSPVDHIKNRMVDWYLDYLYTIGTPLQSLDMSIQESPVSNPANSVLRGDRLLAPDFLRTVTLALEIRKYCHFHSDTLNFLELGAGYGGLARTLKLFYPGAHYTIIDLPETLVFSSLFLRLNFPNARVHYVTSAEERVRVADYDFVFVPTKFADALLGNEFALFSNTASLGEMTNATVRHWLDFVQNRIPVRYFFGLNRFLNTIDPVQHAWRLNENRCSISFDGTWRVLQWEVEPPLARCPYLETEVSRNLEIILERLPKSAVNPFYQKHLSIQMTDCVAKEDWWVYANADNTMKLRDNILVHDFTRSGALFKLWESIRLQPRIDNITMMLAYMKMLERDKSFEEAFYYRELLAQLEDQQTGQEETAKHKAPDPTSQTSARSAPLEGDTDQEAPIACYERSPAARIGLADQTPLAEPEVKKALRICERIERLVADRAAIVRTRGLDPVFALPDANWSDGPHNEFCKAYRHVLRGDYQTLNTLRFFVPFFSGYRLRSFEFAFCGKPTIEPIPDDYDASLPSLLPALKTDTWVERWRAMTRLLPSSMIAQPPQRLGEVGWKIDGVIVNHDTCVYQERLNLLMESGIIDLLRGNASHGAQVRVLEIGGGYGAVGGFLKPILPEATYTICDLPESLLFSSLYLGLTQPDAPHLIYDGAQEALQADTRGFRFVPNYLFDDLLTSNQTFDLVINTLSMSEMSEAQVRTYGAGIRQLIGADGVFFEQNQDNRHIGLNYCKEYLSDYFAHRTTLRSVTLPGLTEGIADIWSNRPLADVLQAAAPLAADWENYREATVDACLKEIIAQLNAQQITADHAIDHMLNAVAVHPKIAPIVAAVGETLCRSGATMASVRLFEGITLACPDEGSFHNLYGEALFQVGSITKARAAFVRASQLAPEEASIHNNLAVVSWHLGEPDKALAHIETATRLDPNYTEAATNLAAMRAALSAAA